MKRIAARLRALGGQKVLRIEWKDAPEGGDAADCDAETVLKLIAAAKELRPQSNQPAEQSPGLAPPTLESWPEPVSGLTLPDDFYSFLKRFIAVGKGAFVALALWIALVTGSRSPKSRPGSRSRRRQRDAARRYPRGFAAPVISAAGRFESDSLEYFQNDRS